MIPIAMPHSPIPSTKVTPTRGETWGRTYTPQRGAPTNYIGDHRELTAAVIADAREAFRQAPTAPVPLAARITA
jgi:hypothetical protein